MRVEHGCMRFIEDEDGWRFEVTDRDGGLLLQSPKNIRYLTKGAALQSLLMAHSQISVELASLGKTIMEK